MQATVAQESVLETCTHQRRRCAGVGAGIGAGPDNDGNRGVTQVSEQASVRAICRRMQAVGVQASA